MKTFTFEQFLPISIETAWEFFSSPNNLERITPEKMTFKITSKVPEKAYEGLLISYRISPFAGLKFNWLTEITHLKHHQYFIDEQRFGPYKLWHHEHHFTVVEGGVMMHDILTYDVGKSIFGWLASKLFVDKQVQEIFDHRYTTLEKIFGKA